MTYLHISHFNISKLTLNGTLKITGLAVTSLYLCLTGCKKEPQTEQKNANAFCERHQKSFSYNLCSIEQKALLRNDKYKLQLFWRSGGDNTDQSSEPLLRFNRLKNELANNETLQFATNAGMYNEKYAPIGYTVIEGKQILSLNLNEGAGNFHLMPNGVFWRDESGFYISESTSMKQMLQSGAQPIFATQSGPMLVMKGRLHPAFMPDSASKKIRNGVGVCTDGTIKFVNSSIPVNFYKFAKLFQETLKCDNALFLDGGIASSMYAPDIAQHDKKNMGVMVGLVEKN